MVPWCISFNESDQHSIVTCEDDIIIWKPSKDGNFSVKSAYALASNFNLISSPSTSWIWKPFCGPRQNFFIWRIHLQAIPTLSKLSSFVPQLLPTCKLCNSYPEDIMHILRDCPVIATLWGNLSPLPQNFFTSPFPDWLKNNCSDTSPSILNTPWNTIFAYFCFTIWHHRNLHIFQNKPLITTTVFKQASHSALEYHYLGLSATPKNSIIHHLVKWKEPKTNFCKLNIDSSASDCFLGAEGIIRNEHGEHIISFCKFVGHGNSIQAELWALQMGLQTAKDLNITHLEIEHFLSAFESWDLKHIYREANGCADALANHARSTRCNSSTFLDPPSFLLPSLTKDGEHCGTIRRLSFKPP
ncbi:reverse transcriptase [Senna tora]|uniref:Reverse transcriptase n=1 Tax=Senna tora TaxID=362788 RepID=A0A834X7V2_9FABA|nr:reverse transcriptase [Senna tora]